MSIHTDTFDPRVSNTSTVTAVALLAFCSFLFSSHSCEMHKLCGQRSTPLEQAEVKFSTLYVSNCTFMDFLHWSKIRCWTISEFLFCAYLSILNLTWNICLKNKKKTDSIRKNRDFICQGQEFDICNMWFSLLLMETGWVKCTTSGYIIKHTHRGPHSCTKLSVFDWIHRY